jgi:hypothetical protein
MTTFGQMTDEVARKLAGYTLRQDRQTHITAAVSATDTSITVASAANMSAGIIQIDDELIYIDSFDRTTGVLTVPPYGRGYNGTTARSHTIGSRVIISPTFPSVDIKNAINQTIIASYPDVYSIGTYTFTWNPAISTYSLPDDVERILHISYESIGPSKEWVPIRRWRLDTMSNTGAFDSRASVTIISSVHPGRTVNVYYTSVPQTLSSNADNFATVTGLPESCQDVIVLGAAAHLASFVDPGRLTFGSAESDQQSQVAGRAYGAGTNAAKYLYALYQQRLQYEAQKLDNRNPIRLHYTN